MDIYIAESLAPLNFETKRTPICAVCLKIVSQNFVFRSSTLISVWPFAVATIVVELS